MPNFPNMMMPHEVGAHIQQGFEKGQKRAQEMRKQQALADFAQDPNNPQAVNALLATAPELGFKAMEHQRQTESRNALAEYVISSRQGGGGSEPGGVTVQGPGQRGADLAALTPSNISGPVPQGGEDSGLSTMGQHGQQEAPQQASVDLSVLGQPRSRGDHLFLRAVRADPIKALEIDSDLRDNFVKRLKTERDLYDFAVSRMAGVQDDAGYQAVIAEAERIGAPMGIDVRQAVPPSFPGAEGIEQLRTRALTSKDQIDVFLREANIEADNERADRNTDSMIEEREARTGIARDRVEVSRDLGVRRDQTTRRGQDVRDATQRRGQDKRGAGKVVSVKTPEEAMKLPPGTVFKTPDGRVKVR